MKQEIPIFFSADDNYIPCLSVALKSLEENVSDENNYKVIVLHTGMTDEGKNAIKEMETYNVKVDFFDITEITKNMGEELLLRCRDYYSPTIYYRMFIPSLFPQYDKALYLDSDIVVRDDIAKLYNTELGSNYVGAITDAVANSCPELVEYVVKNLGLNDGKEYFNSGVLVMNLKAMRDDKIKEKFVYLLMNYNLDTIAPDQDYLNLFCKGKVVYIPETWDKMPDFGEPIPVQKLHLIHYNMFRKPWLYEDVPYADEFWKYANMTPYFEELQLKLKNYTDTEKARDAGAGEIMVKRALDIIEKPQKFIDVLHTVENM